MGHMAKGHRLDMNWGHCREDTATVHGPHALASGLLGHPSISDFNSNNINYYIIYDKHI